MSRLERRALLEVIEEVLQCATGRRKAIVAEYILPELLDTSFVAKLAFRSHLIMMAWVAGKERTEKEFEALAKAGGFKGFHVACIAYDHIMEFLKN